MSYFIEGQKIGTEKSAVALEAGRGVVMTASGWNYPSAGAKIDGVTGYAVEASEATEVLVDMVPPAIAGGAIAKGAEVEMSTSGKFITLDTGVAVGRALTSASADGSEFALKLH